MANETMTANYTNGGKMTFTVGRKTIVTDNDMYCEHRIHINHWQCNCPDSWVALNGVDEDGKHYTVWYKCENRADPDVLENIDWTYPYDIEDEYSDRIWVNEDQEEDKQIANATIVEFFYHGRFYGEYNTMTGILRVRIFTASEVVFKHYANKYNAKRGFKRIVRAWEGVWRP